MKTISMRPLDHADVRELIAAYGGTLNVSYIRSELDTVMEASDERRALLESWLRSE